MIEIKMRQIADYVPIEVQLLRDAQKYIERAETYAWTLLGLDLMLDRNHKAI